jgi:hypothetical protein
MKERVTNIINQQLKYLGITDFSVMGINTPVLTVTYGKKQLFFSTETGDRVNQYGKIVTDLPEGLRKMIADLKEKESQRTRMGAQIIRKIPSLVSGNCR